MVVVETFSPCAVRPSAAAANRSSPPLATLLPPVAASCCHLLPPQDKCDTLFRDLLKAGYPCLSLHGGKDQSDRESTIADFKVIDPRAALVCVGR